MKTIIPTILKINLLILQSICIALGQIWSNKIRSILTTIGIVIGVASVAAVIASLTGLKAKVLEDFEAFGTNKIYIWAHRPKTGPKSNIDWWLIKFRPKNFENILRHCPSLAEYSFTTHLGSQTVSYSDKIVQGVSIRGVSPSWFSIEQKNFKLGRPFSVVDDMQSRHVCVITSDLRDSLMLDKDCINETIRIGNHSFQIIGIVESNPQYAIIGADKTKSFAIIPFGTSQKLKDNWIEVIASAKSTSVNKEAQAEMKFFLRKVRDIKPGEPDTFRVLSVENEMERFDKTATMITLVAGGIVCISLLVGGVGIMNIMLVSVSERTKEIGLRKALGAKNSAILLQFLIEAIVLCLIGGIIGFCLAEAITIAISSMSPVMDKTAIPLWAIGISFGFAGSVGIIFGFFPALKAAMLNPIDALRHE